MLLPTVLGGSFMTNCEKNTPTKNTVHGMNRVDGKNKTADFI